ncbi:hypothetical protein ACIQLG_19795 [Terribacillus saccharophilus]|jgi:hypothetical protein|uniref:hypothetical protein n=1 Tax=Terribacillus saccharophilus TaxID=361277 RepID=UPI00381E9F02
MNTARKLDAMQDVAYDEVNMTATVPLTNGMIYAVVNGEIKAVEPPESGHGNYDICYKDGQPFSVNKTDKVRF